MYNIYGQDENDSKYLEDMIYTLFEREREEQNRETHKG
jgi:hypothetical protein